MRVWGPYDATFVGNYDGDSITVSFEVWEGIHATGDIRLGGVDTPEVGWRAKCDRERELGAQAKAFVYKTLTLAKEIKLRYYKRGKFGRLLVDLEVDGVDLTKLLIRKGLARAYYGGKRQGWC